MCCWWGLAGCNPYYTCTPLLSRTEPSLIRLPRLLLKEQGDTDRLKDLLNGFLGIFFMRFLGVFLVFMSGLLKGLGCFLIDCLLVVCWVEKILVFMFFFWWFEGFWVV